MTNGRPRVVHIGRDIARTGGGEVIKQVSRRMAAHGYSVYLITDTPKTELELPGVGIINTPFGGQLLRWTPASRLGWTLRHTAQIAVFTFAATLLAVPHRVRGSVIFNHNCEALLGQVLVMHNVFSAELERRQLGRIRKVRAYLNPVRAMRLAKEVVLTRLGRRILIAVSEESAHDVEALTTDPERVVVVSNGIDVDHFSPRIPVASPSGAFEEWWTDSACSSLIAFIGHEFKRKGLLELLQALDHLPESVGLVVMGGGAEPLFEYRSQAQQSGRARRVLFLGEITDVRPYLRRSDVLCLPSYYESLGLVGLEALASGVPIVVTRDQPLARYVVPGLNGATCDHQPEGIAEAIELVLEFSGSHTAKDVAESVQGLGWESAVRDYVRVAHEAASRGTER